MLHGHGGLAGRSPQIAHLDDPVTLTLRMIGASAEAC